MFSSYPDLIDAYAEIIARLQRGRAARHVRRQCREAVPDLREDDRERDQDQQHLPDLTATRVHHIGMSVASLDRALAFWEAFLGVERALAHCARPALSRPACRLSRREDRRRLRRPAGRRDPRAARLSASTAGCRIPRRPPIPAICISAWPSTDARSAWERAVALRRQARGAGGAGRRRRRAEQGRARRLSAHP